MAQGTRTFTIVAALGLSVVLVALSLLGTLRPAEGIAQVPLTLLQSIFGDAAGDASTLADDLAEFQTLRERNRELEEALAVYQSELAELRAFRNDFERLADLVNYVGQAGTDWRYAAADVVGRDVNGIVRMIQINAGTRDGVAIGDPVVTPVGLVGRVIRVSATGSQVLLITDTNSSVNARVLNDQESSGLLRGSLSGELVLDLVDVTAPLAPDQQIFTSGETQNFPPSILLGQISSVRFSPDELFRQATVQSLVDFDNLQTVLVITNWEPVDLELLETPTDEEAQ